MLNYEIPSAVLEPLVPKHTVLDLFEGRALASMVGFRFLNTRVLGVPVPFHRDFDEVNLRFYVKRPMPDGSTRRGVVFVRELVPRAAIAYTARLLYNEPYSALPMHSRVPPRLLSSPGRLMYGWFGNAQHQQLSATAIGEPQPLARSRSSSLSTIGATHRNGMAVPSSIRSRIPRGGSGRRRPRRSTPMCVACTERRSSPRCRYRRARCSWPKDRRSRCIAPPAFAERVGVESAWS